MLKQRMLTAGLLTSVFLIVLFAFEPAAFSVFITLTIGLGAWEWAALAAISQPLARVAYAVFVLAVCALLSLWLGLFGDSFAATEAQAVMSVSGLWWAIVLLWVQGYPSSAVMWGHPLARFVMGLVVLVPAWAAFIVLRQMPQGDWLILLLVGCVAAADSGAFFVGRRFGRAKLAPKVSPGKSWAGFYGGLASSALLGGGIALSGWLPQIPSLQLIIIIMLVSMASVLGDLLESMAKRHQGVKDSSNLLPGHGGVLDRIDSLTAAAPIFALAMLMSGH